MASRKPDGVVTPLMFEVFEVLVSDPDAPAKCGRVTRQKLVREGLAEYLEDSVPGPGWTKWDREMKVTEEGRKLVADPSLLPLSLRYRLLRRVSRG